MSAYPYASIDPMALFLSDRAYLIWTELHHPHEPAVGKIATIAKELTAAEKKYALAKAKALTAYCKAVEESVQAK